MTSMSTRRTYEVIPVILPFQPSRWNLSTQIDQETINRARTITDKLKLVESRVAELLKNNPGIEPIETINILNESHDAFGAIYRGFERERKLKILYA